MGNELYQHLTVLDQPKNVLSEIKSFLKAKKANRLNQNDKFIIKYFHTKQHNHKHFTNINQIQQKRIVFISLIGLYTTWKNCPLIELFPAMFILPLKREWIYYPSKYIKEIQSSFIYKIICNLFSNSNINQIKEFIELLRWKDSQQLAFWSLNDYPTNKNINCKIISPFWCNFNTKLCQLTDPITNKSYEPIIMNELWWRDPNKYDSKYDVPAVNILTELYFATMKYDSVQEIIFKSNPNSLYPITSYHNGITSHNMRLVTNKELFDLYGTFSSATVISQNSTDANSNWFISKDYDPYDI